MKKIITFIFLIYFPLLFSQSSSATQILSISYDPQSINEITISGSSINMIIKKKSEITKDESTILSWETSERRKKITVASNLVNSKYILNIEAKNITGGISTGKVLISTYEQDIITNINDVEGMCNIEYLAQVTKNNKKGKDLHFIFFTLTDS